jgi:hypothetical protein
MIWYINNSNNNSNNNIIILIIIRTMKACPVDMFHSLKYLFIDSSSVSFSRFLSLLIFSRWLRTSLCVNILGGFVGYDQTTANDVRPCCFEFVLPKFVSYIIILDLISSCMVMNPTQHPYFSDTHLLNVFFFTSILHHTSSQT